MENGKAKCARTDAPQDFSRRHFGAALAAGTALATIGAVAPVLAEVRAPFPEPRASRKPPAPFAWRVTNAPEKVGLSAERLKQVDAHVQGAVDGGKISGAVVALARRGQLVRYQAFGYSDVQTKAPLAVDAIYRMASSTKPMTGVALMKLVEQSKIRLHDPVSRFIPAFKNMNVAVLKPGQPERRPQGGAPRQVDLVPASREITIIDLATHTSGLNSGGPGADFAPQRDPNDTLADFIPKLASMPLDFQPGTKWSYGVGIDVLGYIVEIVSGQDLDTYMRQNIFEPLGMVDTYFNVPQAKWARVLPQQRKAGGQWQVTPSPATAPVTKFYAGGGGLFSTCKDNLLFEQMLVNGGELNGKRILGTRAIEAMSTNYVGNLYDGPIHDQPGHGYGVTVRVVLDSPISNTGRSNGAFGWQGAFGTMAWADPAEEIAAAIMLQQPDLDFMFDFERIVRSTIID